MKEANKSLFQINTELFEVVRNIEEAGGEATPEQENALQISRQELKTKGLNYVHYIKKLENDLELAKVYEEQLKAFKARKEKTIEKLKSALLDAVDLHGPIEADIFKIGTRKSESVEITEESRLPMHYYTQKIVKSIDKMKIKEDLKNGQDVPGAILRQNKNLSIK